MSSKQASIRWLLKNKIEPINQAACLKMYEDLRQKFADNYGSTHNHQSWPGGLWDHLQEVMNIATELYACLEKLRSLPFSTSDVLLCLFLHDMDKPGAFAVGQDGELHRHHAVSTKDGSHAQRVKLARQYGIILTEAHQNAIKYAEGELGDYTNKRRVMNELAAFVHACDILSARLWHGHPLSTKDPWKGSKRHQSRI